MNLYRRYGRILMKKFDAFKQLEISRMYLCLCRRIDLTKELYGPGINKGAYIDMDGTLLFARTTYPFYDLTVGVHIGARDTSLRIFDIYVPHKKSVDYRDNIASYRSTMVVKRMKVKIGMTRVNNFKKVKQNI